MIDDIIALLPLGLFTLLSAMYSIGHNEYKKGKRSIKDYKIFQK